MNPWEREQDQLDRDLADGLISLAEYNSQSREIARDYRESAMESAREAYERELGNW